MTLHPQQPVEMFGPVARYKPNKVVEYLLDHGGVDLNDLAIRFNNPEFDDDRGQLAQLIGYSVSGFGDLSYASASKVAQGDREAEMLSVNKSESATVTVSAEHYNRLADAYGKLEEIEYILKGGV